MTTNNKMNQLTGSSGTVPDNQFTPKNRLPTAGDKRKQMQLMNNVKRNRLSIDRRNYSYQVIKTTESQSDNVEIERMLYGGTSNETSSYKDILENLEIYNRTRLRTNAKKKVEQQKRLQNVSQDIIVIPDDELPSNSKVVSQGDEQAIEPTSSNMDESNTDNCKVIYGRGKTKSLSIKSQDRILQNVKNYNNSIQKDESTKNVITLTRKKNIFKLSKISYQRIVNIGYSIMPKGTVYKCFILNCAFQSYDKDIFHKHVVVYHDSDCEVKLIDSCGICQKGITLETLEEEFNHMINCHINGSADESEKVQTDTLPSVLKQALLRITVNSDDSINDKSKEIETIDLVEESQPIIKTIPDTTDNNKHDKVQSIVDPLDKTIEEQLQILDDGTNVQENIKVLNDKVEHIAVQLVEKTIEEQLQILDSVQESPTKIIIPLINCVICTLADQFEMIKCNDCDNWIHNTCKQAIENKKNCQHLKLFNVSKRIDKPKELSTDDLLEILSPGIDNGFNKDTIVKDKDELNINVSEEPAKYETKPKPDKYDKEKSLTEYETKAYSNKYNTEPIPAKYENKTEPTSAKYQTRAYCNNYETRAYSNKYDKKQILTKHDRESTISNHDKYPTSDKYETEATLTKNKTNKTPVKHDKESNPNKYETEPITAKCKIKATHDKYDTLPVPSTENDVVKFPNEELHKPNTIDKLKSMKKMKNEVDQNANKVDLNTKQLEPDWNEALPMHEVFKLIKKLPTKTKFFKFSAMQPWEKSRTNVKSKKACTSMTNKNGLISTFKCLGKMCSFFTSNATIFHEHLTLHSRSEKDSLFDFFLFCSYCSFEATSIDSLIEHIHELHCANQYQCPFCFYRCIEAQSCSVHVKNYHNEKPHIFYECPVKDVKYDINKLNIRLLENRENFVLPVPCSGKFNFILNIESY